MQKLRHVLNQEDTVLFIGSGISQWSGLPSWGGMIEELAVFVANSGEDASLIRAEAIRGDLLQAASYGFDKLTKHQIGEFVRTACRYGTAKPHSIHEKIVSLGPRCFVTTNYDNLLEQSLTAWKPNHFFPPPITNRHLTETARIIHARTVDFIFKPHGDAGDADSIILTREQYRSLLPQGERRAALESLKILLASRPVIYLGFGLRDPDFIYLRDVLANIYMGGVRDHYAVMADVTDGEIDYWRRHYGIHLVQYQTTTRVNGSRDHSALLSLLDSVCVNTNVRSSNSIFEPRAPDTILALARYASSLTAFPRVDPELQIRVHAEKPAQRSARREQWDKFDGWPVSRFLCEGPNRSLLVGLPGAGKSYAIRRAVAEMAKQLHDACLADAPLESLVFPIFVDLKLYRGDILGLVADTLPKKLPLNEILRHFSVKIFVDSFNEMPREYLESSSHELDFAKFAESIGGASFVIGSRTSDGLDKLGLPPYVLDEIDEDALDAEMDRRGIEIHGRFSDEVTRLLSRPFFFQYVASGTVVIPKEGHPRDFYRIIFQNLSNAFEAKFQCAFDITGALADVAYDALNLGEEAFQLAALLDVLRGSTFKTQSATYIDAREIANWLISSSILVPFIGGRVAFVHQSITEYLASTKLASLYRVNSQVAREKLRYTRWDQAIYLTLSLLPADLADSFLQDIVAADFVLALKAAKYLEINRDKVVSVLLKECPRHVGQSFEMDHSIAWAVERSLPVSDVHESLLWDLFKIGNSLGGAAARRLVTLNGDSVKSDLIEALVEFSSDYNMGVNSIGPALSEYATEEDARVIADRADRLELKMGKAPLDDVRGFVGGAGTLLSRLDVGVLRQCLLPSQGTIPRLRGEILCRVLTNHHHRRRSPADLELAAELLMRNVPGAAFAIHLLARRTSDDPALPWKTFTEAHIDRLADDLDDSESWALPALQDLCAHRADAADYVIAKARNMDGIRRAALMCSASSSNSSLMFEAIEWLCDLEEHHRRAQPLYLLSTFDLDWQGREELVLRCLMLRDLVFAKALFGGSSPPMLENLGEVRVTSVQWWLQWITELLVPTVDKSTYWSVDQLIRFLATYTTRADQERFVGEFNDPNSPFREVLARYILPRFDSVSTDFLSEDAISYLLAELTSSKSRAGNLLQRASTEAFVIDRLLPLMPGASGTLQRNLQSVLHEAGRRHGRRYVFDSDDSS